MTRITLRKGDVLREGDGPPRYLVAWGEVELIRYDHPEDTLEEMHAEAAAARQLRREERKRRTTCKRRCNPQ